MHRFAVLPAFVQIQTGLTEYTQEGQIVMTSIGILGAGTWGTALAKMLAKGGNDVTVWSALEQEIDELSSTHVHPKLPGVELPETIRFTKDIMQACREQQMVIFAVPSVFIRQTAKQAAAYLNEQQVIINVSKGMERDTLFTMTQVIQDQLKKETDKTFSKIVALTGPTHAEEVAVDMPTAIVSACEDIATAEYVQDVFMNTCLRVYTNEDVTGVEICGAMKNIIALAAGILTGLGYGDNTRAALITRGLAEITRLGMAMGCMEQTFYGLAGIGDLIVTATSRHSRNYQCGKLIGQGVPAADAVQQIGMVVEGINAIPAALVLKNRYHVELPIIEAADAVINQGIDPKQAVYDLMVRDKRSELSKRIHRTQEVQS